MQKSGRDARIRPLGLVAQVSKLAYKACATVFGGTFKKTRVAQSTLTREGIIFAIISLFVPGSVLLATLSNSPASAVTSSTLNFQARLLQTSGSLVADGTYNIQFNIYSQASGGSSLWTETYLNSATQGVTVKNGYLSVNLGSITAFGSSIPWDQELWLGMTVRGTGSCSFGACTPTDAEMTPRFKLTAVPYAFTAGRLQAADSGITNQLVFDTPSGSNKTITLPNASGTVCLTSGNCAGIGGTGDILQGGNSFGTAVILGSNDSFGLNLETNGTTIASFSNTGAATFKNSTDSTDGFRVLDTSDTVLFSVDTLNGRVTAGNVWSGQAFKVTAGNTVSVLNVDTNNGIVNLGSSNSFQGQLTFASSSNSNIATLRAVNTLGADVTYQLPNAAAGTYSICISSGNCAGVGGTGDILNNGQNGTVRIGSNDANSTILESNGTDRLTITSAGDSIFTGTLSVDASSTATSSVNIGTDTTITASPGLASTGTYIGSRGYAFSSSTNMDSAWLIGARGELSYNGSGTLNYAVGLQSTGTLNSGGTTNNYRSIAAHAPSILGGSVIGNYGGAVIELPDSANTSNQVGLLITDNIFSQPAGDWAIYTATADASLLGGALTVTGLTTLNSGLTVTGGAVNLNASSNFDTNINTGTSTGAVNIGNTTSADVTVRSGGSINLYGNGGTTGLEVGSLLGSSLSTFQFSGSSTGKTIRTSAQGSSSSAGITLQSGNSGASSGTSGDISITTGNGTGTNTASGSITIDPGTATGTAGTISLGAANASSLILGRSGLTTLNNGALTVAQNLTVDTDTLFIDSSNNKVGIGTTTLTSAGRLVVSGTANDAVLGSVANITGTLNSTTSDATSGLLVNPTVAPASSSALNYYGVVSNPTSSSSNLNSGAALLGGFLGAPSYTGTGSLINLIGAVVGSGNLGTGTITHVTGLDVFNPTNNGTITNNRGVWIHNMTAGNNDYGLVVENADTYSIWVQGGTTRLDGEAILTTVSGAGLTDCDNATTSKLLWDSTAETFSCGTDQGGGSGVTTVGTFDSQTANANGAVISGSSIYFQSASATVPGMVNTSTQTFAGVKTFNDNLAIDTASLAISDTNGDDLTIGEFGAGAGTIDILLSGGGYTQQNLRIFGDDILNGFAINSFSVSANTTSLSGALTVSGLTTLGTVSGAGLTDCDNATTSKLLWDTTAKTFSCGTDQGGGLSANLTDNVANAWDIQEGTNNYININTTNTSEEIQFGNATTNPDYSFLGSGIVDIAGALGVGGTATFYNDIWLGGDTGNESLVFDTSATGVATIDFDQNNGTDYIQFDNNTNIFTWKAAGVDQLTVSSGGLTVLTNTTFGNATSDTITFTGRVNSNLLPSASATYTMGSDSLRWGNAYFDNTISLGTNSGDQATFTYNSLSDSLLVKNGTNSTTAFQIQNSSSVELFAVNTTDSRVDVGGDLEVALNIGNPLGGIGVIGNTLEASEDLDDTAYWTATNITVTTDATAAPTGLIDAEQLTSSASGTHTLVSTGSWVNSAGTYTFSIWVKTASGTQPFTLAINSTGGTPTSGTARSYTATTAWKRFTVTQTFTGSPSEILPVITMTNNSATIYAWGAQMLQASTAGVYTSTSYGGMGTMGELGAVVNGRLRVYDSIFFGNSDSNGTNVIFNGGFQSSSLYQAYTDLFEFHQGGGGNTKLTIDTVSSPVISSGTNMSITISPNGTGDVLLPLDDGTNVQLSGTRTNTGAHQTIDVTLGNDAGVDIVSALQITATSAATGDNDSLIGILIDDIVSPSATVSEIGLLIGAGWNSNIYINDTTAVLSIADTGSFTFEDDPGNALVSVIDDGTTGSLYATGYAVGELGLVVGDGSSNYLAIVGSAVGANYDIAIPTVTGNDTFCLVNLANCGSSVGNTLTLGDASNAGTLVLSDGSSNTISLTASGIGTNYSLTFPTTAGTTGQCLQTDSVTASQLIFGSCSSGSGDGGVTSIGGLDSQTPNSNGAVISGTLLYLQSASSTNAGLVNTTTQTFAGNKTFTGTLTVANITPSGNLTIGTSDTTGTLLVLDTKTDSGDPSGVNGGLYYNSNDHDFRAYENGNWGSLKPARYAFLTADRANATTSYADVTDLSFSIAANTNYEMECSLVYQSTATTTGIGFSLNGPASPNLVSGLFTTTASASTAGAMGFNAYNGGSFTQGVATANANMHGLLKAYIRNGANAGTLQLRFKAETTGTVTTKTDSFCKLIEL